MSPVALSSASTRRATVGWAIPSLRDAANVEPSLTTARKTRTSDQF
jgi:hypothetical protein